MRKHILFATIAAIIGALPGLAFAHPGHADATVGLWAGVLHPISGVDHIVVMIALGIWAAQLGAPAIWVLPIAFPLLLALGGAAGVLALPVPGIEIGIALSAIVFGLLIALSVRRPRRAAGSALLGLLVAAFAIFHGYAHGAELPQSADAISYSVGFVLATGLLHGLGISLGIAKRWATGMTGLRLVGCAIALCGVYLLIPQFAAI